MNITAFVLIFIVVLLFFNILYQLPYFSSVINLSKEIQKFYNIFFEKFGIKLNETLATLLNALIISAIIYSLIKEWKIFVFILISFLILVWILKLL